MKEADDIRGFFRELALDIEFLVEPYPCLVKPYPLPDMANISQVERRLLIKSIFSFIEAVGFQLKTLALIKKSNCLSTAEIALAREEDYDLDDNGQAKVRKAKLRTLLNFRFATIIFAKACETEYKMNVNCPEWEALRKSIKVRDRLMHPKKLADLIVSDEETREALQAYEWVWDQIGRMIVPAMKQILKSRE